MTATSEPLTLDAVVKAAADRGVDEAHVVLTLRTGERVVGWVDKDYAAKHGSEVILHLHSGAVRGLSAEEITQVEDVASLPAAPAPPMLHVPDELKRPSFTVLNAVGPFPRTALFRVAQALVNAEEAETTDSAVLLCQQAAQYFGRHESGRNRSMGEALAECGVDVGAVRRELRKVEQVWQRQLEDEERQQLSAMGPSLAVAGGF